MRSSVRASARMADRDSPAPPVTGTGLDRGAESPPAPLALMLLTVLGLAVTLGAAWTRRSSSRGARRP